MSPEAFHHFITMMLHVMQASIVVPMAVVWRRRRHFPAPIKLLSGYIYLSVFCVIGGELGRIYLHNNLYFLAGFNVGKVLLFMAVYSRVMPLSKQFIQRVVVVYIAIVLGFVFFNMGLAVDLARVLQCAVLAGFALLYMDFMLQRPHAAGVSQNPLWLLSVGQLLYSAGTVTGFSIEYVAPPGALIGDVAIIFLSLSGLTFNGFLTLAFLRARHSVPLPKELEHAAKHLVNN